MCKCQDTTDFKKALRIALSETTATQKLAVWENPENKKIYYGTVKEAESRLKKGKIECYFIPKKRDKEVTFSIVEKPEPEPEKAGKSKPGKAESK